MICRASLLLAAVPAAAIAQPYVPPPKQAPAPAAAPATAASTGQALFGEKCGMCHRKGGMGTILLARRVPPATAELEKRTDLTLDYVTAAARVGIGNMPRISRGEASDAQLARIALYLSRGAGK